MFCVVFEKYKSLSFRMSYAPSWAILLKFCVVSGLWEPTSNFALGQLGSKWNPKSTKMGIKSPKKQNLDLPQTSKNIFFKVSGSQGLPKSVKMAPNGSRCIPQSSQQQIWLLEFSVTCVQVLEAILSHLRSHLDTLGKYTFFVWCLISSAPPWLNFEFVQAYGS